MATRASDGSPGKADDAQIEVRAAWLYYMEGHTQAAIARRLGTTRLRINRILVDAQRNGLVGITLNAELTSCIALERALVRDFALDAAVIVPTPADDKLVPVVVGRAAAGFVGHHLQTQRTRGLGIGWGLTLREMARHMPFARYPDLSVCSMMGGITHGLEFNTFDLAAEVARRLRSQCRYLVAPVYASSAASREAIMAQPVFGDALARVAACDMAVLSIGDVTRRSMLVRYALPDDVRLAGLRAAGAVCDIIGQFVDAAGRVIDHPLNRRAIAFPLRELASIPTVVFAAGGRHKVRAIAAALRAGFGSVLVCDEDTARAAMQLVQGGARLGGAQRATPDARRALVARGAEVPRRAVRSGSAANGVR
ncbi:MAG: sugar-binding transcriptional regulator [Casimicrobiaceae bacterium]